jgi:D-glucuronyl C5-epimerase C-terminus/Bacterial Ig-like domain
VRTKPLLGGVLALAIAVGGLCLALTPTRATATRGPSVTAALQSLKQSGQITPAVYQQDNAAYSAAQATLKKLKGTRHSELAGVVANVQAIAAAGGFIPSRLPALFLTLERNRQYWTSGALLSYSQRVSFPGSLLVWESYPGQGIEIQWLATFGEANGYYLSGNNNANLRKVLGEILPLATQRAGGIAWEYMFQFDGGLPPWTSGLSQGTALQVLSRAWSRFKEPVYLTAAQQALGIFQTPPPVGIRVSTAVGAHYLEYTYAPKERILNGFIQSLVGLYDYAAITKDPLGLKLFEAGDAEARVEVPHYDTGAWSLYDQREESDLNYHDLLLEFLQHLCQRTQQGPPFMPSTATPIPTPGHTPGPAPTPSTPPAETGASGGTTATATAAKASANAIVADQIYCTTAEHFTTYLHTSPVVELLSHTLPGGTRAGVQFSLSKVSRVSISVTQNGHTVWTNSAQVTHGKPKILWVTPAKGGVYTVTVHAVDLAGNSANTSGTITVSAKKKANAGAAANRPVSSRRHHAGSQPAG